MDKLNQKKESTPIEKPVKPKKPLPTKEESMKIPVPCLALAKNQIREIVREEIIKWNKENFMSTLMEGITIKDENLSTKFNIKE